MHMPTPQWWAGAALVGLLGVCGISFTAEAASASQTVGVQIIMPQRPDRAVQTDAAAQPSEEPAQSTAPATSGQMTTLAHQDGAAVIVYTEVPAL